MTADTAPLQDPPRRRRFALRAMTSVLLTCSFAMLLVSGYVLFIAPPGRIANWNGWNVAGIGKHDWGGLHIWFAVLFLAASVLHIFYNWRVLVAYFKHRHTRRIAFRLEWAVALLICFGVFAGTRAGIVPFSSLLGLSGCGGDKEESGGRGGNRGRGATTGGVDQCASPAAGQTNGAAAAAGSFHGGGMGRRTLADVCATEKVEIRVALERLAAKGLKATPEQTLRDIAASGQLGRPGELVSIIRGEIAPAH